MVFAFKGFIKGYTVGRLADRYERGRGAAVLHDGKLVGFDNKKKARRQERRRTNLTE